MKNLKFSIFLLFLLGPMVVSSQEIKNLSLEQAKQFALENNYGVKNSLADQEIAKKKIFETTTIGLPQVNAEGNFRNFLNIPTQVLPANAFNPMADPNELVPIQFGTNYTASGEITASQLVFDGAYIVGLMASRVYGRMASEQVVKSRQDVVEDVSMAYYTVLIVAENKKILQGTLETTEKLLWETTKIYESGFVEESDVDQLNLLAMNIKNGINKIDRQLDISQMLLKLNMGMDINTPIALTDALSSVISSLEVETLYNKEFQVKNNINYQLASTQKNLMALNLRRERVAYLPSLSAFINHQEMAFRNEFTFFQDKPWYPATVWGLSMRLPIFDSGMKYSKIQQAKLEVEKANNMQILAEQSLKLQSQAAKGDYISAFERMKTEKENLVLAEKIKNKTEKKYQEGVASSFELNQIHNQYLNTQSNYINTVFELLSAKTKFEKIMTNQ
jgi:outer membrane protein